MTELGTATIIRGDARALPLEDDSVDLIVTSPPYFALRSYQDDGEHYAGQIGSEPTPAEWLDALLEVTRECVRVLKPSGSLWVNLGDKYVSAGGSIKSAPSPAQSEGSWGTGGKALGEGTQRIRITEGSPLANGARNKSLMGMPWRYALACIDQLGLILRAELIWAKPNGLPEAVTDRVRRSHEQWFHFTLMPRYYSAVDEIREAYSERVQDRQKYVGRSTTGREYAPGDRTDQGRAQGILGFGIAGGDPLGKLPGSVWTIPSEPLTVPASLGVDHFAAFPSEWPKRIIRGWSPAGVCVECGEGRRPVVAKALRERNRNVAPTRYGTGRDSTAIDPRGDSASNWSAAVETQGSTEATITGYACACPTPTAPTTPGVILDPFGGTGTTALVAKALGRHGITVDLSADYCRIAAWRCNDRNQLAKVLGVEKAEQQPDDQGSLLDLLGGAG